MIGLLKNYGNILIRVLVRLLMHVFYVFPIRKNRILFESYFGKSYSCNPKYISEYLHKTQKGRYEYVWVFRQPELYTGRYFRAVKRNSLKHFLYRLTAKVVITNATDETYLPKRKGQRIINTWHAGGAYKKVGSSYTKNVSIASKWQLNALRKGADLYLSSSKTFTEFNIHEAYGYVGKILERGMPRNDLFFSDTRISRAKEKVKSFFHIEKCALVLYAPTFRGELNKTNDIPQGFPFLSVLESVKKRYGKEVALFKRSHHAYGDKEISGDSKVIDVTDYPDMQELLAASDILITDYSSCMWDFALLGRPCFLYVPDMDEYNADRGVYTPMETWPGFLCKTEEELLQALSDFTPEEAREKAKAHLDLFGSYETGHATQEVCKKICEFMN